MTTEQKLREAISPQPQTSDVGTPEKTLLCGTITSQTQGWIDAVNAAIGDFEAHIEQCETIGADTSSFRQEIVQLEALIAYLRNIEQPHKEATDK